MSDDTLWVAVPDREAVPPVLRAEEHVIETALIVAGKAESPLFSCKEACDNYIAEVGATWLQN